MARKRKSTTPRTKRNSKAQEEEEEDVDQEMENTSDDDKKQSKKKDTEEPSQHSLSASLASQSYVEKIDLEDVENEDDFQVILKSGYISPKLSAKELLTRMEVC